MDSKDDYLKLAIIIDIGSGEVKAGFSGEEKPKAIFKNYFGEPKYKKVLRTFNKERSNEINEQYIGDDCEKYMGVIKLRYPVKHGVFSNDQDILSIFNHIYSKLEVDSQEIKEHPVLVTEPLLNPYTNREKIASVLFDNLGVPALFFASQPILSLFSTSSTSGAVLESGEGVTQSCVVYEGYSIPCSYERFDYGGADVTEYLRTLLKKKGYPFYNSTEFRLVNEIKEQLCYCDYNIIKVEKNKDAILKSEKDSKKTDYYLPDGSSINLEEEKSLAPEILFNPGLIGKEYLSFQDMIHNSINKVDIELRAKSYNFVLLCGGNTAIKGVPDKTLSELKNYTGKNLQIKLQTAVKPQYCCWIGGNVITTLEIFKKMWVRKKEWDEKGPKILHIKTI